MDLAGLFFKTGVKNQRVALLLTDAHIPDERFLVVINDLLAAGQSATICFIYLLYENMHVAYSHGNKC